LTSYDLDMTGFTVGDTLKIRLGVENHVDELLSDSVNFLLADVPDAPDPPTRTSDGTQLIIHMTEPASDGGT